MAPIQMAKMGWEVVRRGGVAALAIAALLFAGVVYARSELSRPAYYPRAEATQRNAHVDTRLDQHEQRIKNSERLGEKYSDMLYDIREAVRRIEGQLEGR